MAASIIFRCDHCSTEITAWSDGNPYYINAEGKKEYAYHPDHKRLKRCIGNDIPYFCLSCGHEFLFDNCNPIDICPHCQSGQIVDIYDELWSKPCPYCKNGVFRGSPGAIS